jgi:LmbE family N-acetylglucosaminyl deacetylase
MRENTDWPSLAWVNEATGRPWLILAAHPDDETLGASWLLCRLRHATVVHVTDGAPLDPQLRPPAVPGGREDYARLRADEARQALALAGVPPAQIRCLGLVDQEAVHELAPLARAVGALIAALAPAAVLVQPYEGGHPDHDACAFAARAAVAACAGTPPALLEMTSYHRQDGTLRAGSFLDVPGAPAALRVDLSAEDRARKSRMLACYRSQAAVLAGLGVQDELLRAAPGYDFRRRPHPGPVHYETLGWPMTADAFCRCASRALAELGLA